MGRAGLIVDTDQMRAALVGKVIVSHWFAAPSAATYRLVQDAERAAANRVGTIGTVTLVSRALINLSAATDKAAYEPAATLMRGRSDYMRASAVIFEAEGFAGAITRSAISTIQLLSRSVVAEKVFSRRADAVEWLAEQMAPLGVRFDGEQLLDELRQLVGESDQRS
ncbi:MAG: hypothetical protein HOV80_34930 [Polyangiaceae bacterium]|nr:hypothetical protein [Polyangiaceae bacterium]